MSLYKFMDYYGFGVLDIDRLLRRKCISLSYPNGRAYVTELQSIYSNNKVEVVEDGDDEYRY